jgi:hypothetical protein
MTMSNLHPFAALASRVPTLDEIASIVAFAPQPLEVEDLKPLAQVGRIRRIRQQMQKLIVPTDVLCETVRTILQWSAVDVVDRYGSVPAYLEWIYKAPREKEQDLRSNVGALSVYGLPGCGKSTMNAALRRVVHQLAPKEVDVEGLGAVEYRPVVGVAAAKEATVKSLGENARQQYCSSDMTADVLSRAGSKPYVSLGIAYYRHGGWLALIDELQNSLARDGAHGPTTILNSFTSVGVPPVWFGNYDLVARLKEGKGYNVDRLLADRIHLLPPTRESADRTKLFEAMLSQSPLGFRCSAAAVADECFPKTYGVPRADAELVAIAIALSVEEGRPVAASHIESAMKSPSFEPKAIKVGSLFSTHPDKLKKQSELWPPFESDVEELFPLLRAAHAAVSTRVQAKRYESITGKSAPAKSDDQASKTASAGETVSGEANLKGKSRSARVIPISTPPARLATPEESLFSPAEMFDGPGR